MKIIDWNEYDTHVINNIKVGDIVNTKEYGNKVVCALGVNLVWIFTSNDKIVKNGREVDVDILKNVVNLEYVDIFYAGKPYLICKVIPVDVKDIISINCGRVKEYENSNYRCPTAYFSSNENEIFTDVSCEGMYLGEIVSFPEDFKCKNKDTRILAIGRIYFYVEAENTTQTDFSTSINTKLIDEVNKKTTDITHYIGNKKDSYVYAVYRSKYNTDRYCIPRHESIKIEEKKINKFSFMEKKSTIPEIKFIKKEIETKNEIKYVRLKDGYKINGVDSKKSYKVIKEEKYTYKLEDYPTYISKGFFDEILQIDSSKKEEVIKEYKNFVINPKKTIPNMYRELKHNTIYTLVEYSNKDNMYYSEEYEIYIYKDLFIPLYESDIHINIEDNYVSARYKNLKGILKCTIEKSSMNCRTSFFVDKVKKWVPLDLLEIK